MRGIMPKQPKPERKPVRIPVPLLDEIDKILKKFPMYGNRQRFIETAIQEKIEEVMRFN
jgi:metal-responsive CopG/Arc/MetJ family transcriptional regulator